MSNGYEHATNGFRFRLEQLPFSAHLRSKVLQKKSLFFIVSPKLPREVKSRVSAHKEEVTQNKTNKFKAVNLKVIIISVFSSLPTCLCWRTKENFHNQPPMYVVHTVALWRTNSGLHTKELCTMYSLNDADGGRVGGRCLFT